jgi:hypothetical protein
MSPAKSKTLITSNDAGTLEITPPQIVGLGQVAQIADAVELETRQRRLAVTGAGRENEVIVLEPHIAFELHRFGSALDRGGAIARQIFDALVAVKRLGTHQQQV